MCKCVHRSIPHTSARGMDTYSVGRDNWYTDTHFGTDVIRHTCVLWLWYVTPLYHKAIMCWFTDLREMKSLRSLSYYRLSNQMDQRDHEVCTPYSLWNEVRPEVSSVVEYMYYLHYNMYLECPLVYYMYYTYLSWETVFVTKGVRGRVRAYRQYLSTTRLQFGTEASCAKGRAAVATGLTDQITKRLCPRNLYA